MMLSAIVFDFDGVIVDTEKLHLRAFQEVLRGRGIELSARDYYDRYLGLDDSGVLRSLARECGLALGDARVAAMLVEKAARYAELLSSGAVLFEGVEGRLRAWSREVPLAIASGSLAAEIDHTLRRYDLLGCFTAIVSANDVAHGKPSPEPYLTALDRLTVAGGTPHPIDPRRVVAVEDSRPGIEAARAAGMRTVAVTTNHEAGRLAGADLIVSSVASLDLPMLGTLARSRDEP